MKLNALLMIITISISSILAGCTRTVVKRELIIEGSPRAQAVSDSLRQQIRDCEKALWLAQRAIEF